MEPTKQIINDVVNSHSSFMSCIIENATPRTHNEVLDSSRCSLGVFLARLERTSKVNTIIQLHKDFHYYCSVHALNYEMGIENSPKLTAVIQNISKDLVKFLREL